MVSMVAKKRVKYPHGSTGREYAAGDAFEALSERDAKGLYIAGKAAYGEKAIPKNSTDLPLYETRAAKSEPLAETDDGPKPEAGRGQYQRRDMTAVGRTGEDSDASSSHPDQALKTRISRKRKDVVES